MKTIRQNTFETNSSSTHAFTIQIDKCGNGPEFKPITDVDSIQINVTNYYSSVDNWRDRLSLVIAYCKYKNYGITNIIEKVEEFLGKKLVIKYETEDINRYSFCYFADRWDRSYSCFEECMVTIVNDDKCLLGFVFSESTITSEEYYDG